MNTMQRIGRQSLRERLMRQAVDRKIEDRRDGNADEQQEASRDVSCGSRKQSAQRSSRKKDSRDKFEKLCAFMYKVAPMSYEWNRAREETKRLKEEGFWY